MFINGYVLDSLLY